MSKVVSAVPIGTGEVMVFCDNGEVFMGDSLGRWKEIQPIPGSDHQSQVDRKRYEEHMASYHAKVAKQYP
jgi:hypothetical protein